MHLKGQDIPKVMFQSEMPGLPSRSSSEESACLSPVYGACTYLRLLDSQPWAHTQHLCDAGVLYPNVSLELGERWTFGSLYFFLRLYLLICMLVYFWHAQLSLLSPASSSCGAGPTLCSLQASHWGGISCCGAWALGHTGSDSCSMWDLLRPGIEPVAPALAGGFFLSFFFPFSFVSRSLRNKEDSFQV